MNFESFAQFLQMGGYARFMWPAYGVALSLLLFNVLGARRALRMAKADARRRLAREQTRDQTREPRP